MNSTSFHSNAGTYRVDAVVIRLNSHLGTLAWFTRWLPPGFAAHPIGPVELAGVAGPVELCAIELPPAGART